MIVRRVLMMALVAAGLVLAGCEREATYPRSTPDELVRSAVGMIKAGEPEKLATLVYADSREMEAMLARLGKLLGNMGALSKAARERWPDEFAKMQADAASGKGTPLLGALLSGSRGRESGAGGQGLDRAQVRAVVNRLFADPYGWLDANAARLTTATTSDDSAVVLLDGEPLIPVVGLPLRKVGDEWWVSLPVTLPPVSGVWPRSRAEWSILASLVTVIDRAVVEMTADIRAGRLSTLAGLRDRAIDKLVFPAGIAFVAYGRELEVRRGVERRTREFDQRRRAWVNARAKALDVPAGEAVSRELVDAIGELARPKIEQWVRTRKAPDVAGMSDREFEALVGGWTTSAGLSVGLDGALAGPAVDSAVAAWRKQRREGEKR